MTTESNSKRIFLRYMKLTQNNTPRARQCAIYEVTSRISILEECKDSKQYDTLIRYRHEVYEYLSIIK